MTRKDFHWLASRNSLVKSLIRGGKGTMRHRDKWMRQWESYERSLIPYDWDQGNKYIYPTLNSHMLFSAG